jgi:molecular chaperone DnaK
MATYKYGIDLGTTNSSIALVESGPSGKRAKVFVVDTNNVPDEIIRSVVGYKAGETYVGNEGLRMLNGNGDNPIRQIKLRLEEDDGEDKEYHGVDGRSLRYSDILGEILRRLREKADAAKGSTRIEGVVIGVPNASSEQFKATYITALIKAGFYESEAQAWERTEFIEESIAVALHYGQDRKHQGKRVLVFDFGGGTLDIALVELKGQSLQSAADNKAHRVIDKTRVNGAGEKFTYLLFSKAFVPAYASQHCAGDIGEVNKLFGSMLGRHIISIDEVWHELENNGIGWQFINELERIKQVLSRAETAAFSWEFSTSAGNIRFKETQIARRQFESAIRPSLDEIRREINKLLKGQKMTSSQVDEVLMAGGTSQIPAVKTMLENLFSPMKVYFDGTKRGDFYINVLTCIAQGLAFAGYRENNIPLVDDVTSFPYGVYDEGRKQIVVIMPKNARIREAVVNKATLEGKYCTDMQQTNMGASSFYFDLYEDKQKIMRLTFNRGRHSGRYKIFFSIDSNLGILTVDVYDTGHCKWLDDIPEEGRRFTVRRRDEAI